MQQNIINPPPSPSYSAGNNHSAAAPALFRRWPMAKNTKKVGGSNSQWTNERHVDFLNSMEASFVQTMFENNGRFPRLDRYLPDTADSTVDLVKERRRRHSASDIVEPSARRTDTKSRILSCQDQVVPQFQNKRDDDKDKDEKDHL